MAKNKLEEIIDLLAEYGGFNREYLRDKLLTFANDKRSETKNKVTMTNREKIINNISELNDDEFTKLFCEMSNCTSCPGKPLGSECLNRLMKWLQQEYKENSND